jgi:acetoin utilization deacetylase AcuC-like enzyme
MTLLYYDPFFLEHRTGGHHPERPERLLHTMRHLERTGLDARCQRPAWEPMTVARLATVHGPEYIQSVKDFSAKGGGRLEEDTVCSVASFDVARLAAGAVCNAVERVVAGEDRQALCLVRPPGHHALAEAAMGFCLFNNVALAARTATALLGLDRVLVVDFDVHHGNGTQAIFWEDPQVGFVSIHRWPFYPGTGSAEETGTGRGAGTIVNLPTEFGTSRLDFRDRFERGLEWLASRMRPQLVLVSAGFDAHREDPVGSLGLEIEDFALLTGMILDVAETYASGKVVSVLEGGYNTGILAGSVEAHLSEMLKRSDPPRAERAAQAPSA